MVWAMSENLVLLPAVDVADGQAVRLVQGEAGSETSYGDPLTAAMAWQEAGCESYVVTDVTKDGMLQGPNLQLLRDVCAETDRPVVASGGITELDDLRALMGLVGDGVEGAIVGTALYEGRFTLTEALELTRP